MSLKGAHAYSELLFSCVRCRICLLRATFEANIHQAKYRHLTTWLTTVIERDRYTYLVVDSLLKLKKIETFVEYTSVLLEVLCDNIKIITTQRFI